MKHFLIVPFAFAFLLLACKNDNKTPETAIVSESTPATPPASSPITKVTLPAVSQSMEEAKNDIKTVDAINQTLINLPAAVRKANMEKIAGIQSELARKKEKLEQMHSAFEIYTKLNAKPSGEQSAVNIPDAQIPSEEKISDFLGSIPRDHQDLKQIEMQVTELSGKKQ